jgi:hypothetical protein
VEIPFSVKGGSMPETQPTAVRVFVSWDRGRTWHFYDERRPEDRGFRFRPRQDGEFWFATQTIDKSGRPDNPEPRQPQLRLIVDTQRPQLLIQAQIDPSGNVQVAWSAADASLAPASLKLEYQDAGNTGGAWRAVEIPASKQQPGAAEASGQTVFRPQAITQLINLRGEIADVAGNVAYHSQRLSLLPASGSAPSQGLGRAADPSATQWATANPHVPAISNGELVAVERNRSTPASKGKAEGTIPNLVNNPFAGSGRLASSPGPVAAESLPAPADSVLPPPVAAPHPSPGGDGWMAPPRRDAFNPAVTSEQARPDRRPSEFAGARDQPASEPPPAIEEMAPAPRDEQNGGAAAPSFSPPLNAAQPDFGTGPSGDRGAPGPELMATPEVLQPSPSGDEAAEPTSAQRPRLTSSRRFSLDYDVESVGPGGVSAVELWGTTDGGRTWLKWGSDPDRVSPFDVEVSSEAVYGFRIVIVSNNGLATSSPQPGDAADIWVSIDLTRPTARLTGASYGQGASAGKLDIRWEATDANLGQRPVTLAMSDRPDGSFVPIAAGLPNGGQYLWEFDPTSPRQIFLRLEVRDEAGNVAVDQLTEAIKVEGLEPKGRIRGFNTGVPGS